MPECILVFDVGTTNFKTMLFDPRGNALFVDSAAVRPAFGTDGMAYQDPLDWRKAVVGGAEKAAAFANEKSLDIIGLSLTASRSSVIPVDRNGKHIAPAMMWQETASREIVNSVNQGETLKHIYRVTGSRANTVYSAPKMTWLRRNRPEIYNQADKLVGIQDYIIKFLTGEFVTDHTFGSRTLLMDIRSRVWDVDMLALFDVEEDKLCRLIQPGSIAGTLTPDAASLTGLPSGLPVITAGGDQNNAALGVGVIRQGDAMVNMGTGSFLVAAVDEPFTDPGMRVMCNASAVPGKYILDAGMLTTGSVHRWFVEAFYNEIPQENMRQRYDLACREAAGASPRCNGLFVLPHFAGRGAPHWRNRAKGAFFGLGLEHRRPDLARAVYEGIAAEIAANLEVARQLINGITDIRLAGGLSRDDIFVQMLSDVCQRTLHLSPASEATARGAWIQAMIGLNRAAGYEEILPREETKAFVPNPELADVYGQFLEERERLFDVLATLNDNA